MCEKLTSIKCQMFFLLIQGGTGRYMMVLGQYGAVLVGTWWYWIRIGWYWSVFGGTGSVESGTG